MSISPSFDTVVARDDPLQFLSDPSRVRKDLDLKGLSDSARKSFSALKPWQHATACFYDPATSLNISKVVERFDECHTAIKTTLAVAQIGRPFADDVAALCSALSEKNESPERLDELLSKLITTAEKGYGRSIQAHGQLICVRHGLSQISEDIPSQVTKIQDETKNRNEGTAYAYPAFNGLNTCFLTIATPMTTNEEETDIWRAPMVSPAYNPYNYLTFQNVITQLNAIAADIWLFTEQIGRCAEWWSKMKDGMETLRDTLQKVAQGGPQSWPQSFKVLDNVTEGWEGVADQFALYVHKTSPVVKDYLSTQIPYNAGNYGQPYLDSYPTPIPYTPPPRPYRRRSRSRSYSPRRPYVHSPPFTPSPTIVATALPPVSDAVMKQEEKPQPLWKRLSCMA